MGIISGIVVYILLWWLVFFTLLPLGIQHHPEQPRGHDRGAPQNPHLWQKIIATSLIAIGFWGIVYWLIETNLISFRN
ncbi:MAG: DUF1467 family protein [Alphaproteobacteria bacterium]